MSPKPFLATITLVIRSGMEVPAARNVNPITCNITNVATFIHANYRRSKFRALEKEMTHTESNIINKIVQYVSCMWMVTLCRMYCCTFLDSYVFLLALVLP